MMDFNEFTEKLEHNLKVALEDSPPGAHVQKQEVKKMQEQSYTALTVTPADRNIGMNINANALYEQMQYGASYQNVLSHALNQATAFVQDSPQFDVHTITNYEQTKTKLFVEVVGAERNAAMLEKLPHVQMEDMAMVYSIQIAEKDGAIASTLISNQLMAAMGVTAEKLYQDAIANSVNMRPAKVQKLSEVLAEMMDVPVKTVEKSAPPLLVVTTEDKIKGACAMFYSEMMDQLAKETGGNFFILPSSVHEVLVMPDKGEMSAEELKDMVTAINGDVVDPADVLTDQVYHYDAKERIFERGDKFEARQADKERKGDRSSVLKDLKDKQKDIPFVTRGSDLKSKADMEL